MAYDRTPQRPRPSRLLLFLILLTILLAYGLRLPNLDAFSFWVDEGLTPLRSSYSVAEILSNRVTIQEGVTRDTHPPFYYLLIHFSRRLWGQTDFAYRYPSLLAGVLLVPLLFQLGRRLGGVSWGVAAALLTAVNPLQIWYAADARMYTLAVLLAAAASYVLWRALTGMAIGRALFLYLIFAGLAVYTHYTAVFLIGAQGLFWVWLLWQRGLHRLLLAAAVVAIIAILPLAPTVVPRLLSGTEANYYYVSPLAMLRDVVHGFGLGLTANFGGPAVLLDGAAVVLLLLGLYAAATWRRRLFLLAYLLAAVLGLMAGSILFKPMYQGVRHIMLGSPAFLLLVAAGLAYLWQQARGRVLTVRWPQKILALAGTALALAAPAVSLTSFYTNENFAKDDYRSMIRFIDERAGGSDLVLYNNAILLPLHGHYSRRPDLAVTALPVYPRVARNPRIAAQLQHLAQQYERIWFVTDPPADERDEERLVRTWLRDQLPASGNHIARARTLELRVITYETRPQEVTQLPENGRSLTIAWDNLPSLQGVQFNFSQPATLPTLWLDLFWQGGEAPVAETYLVFRLVGPDDHDWLVRGHDLVTRAVAAWPGDGLLRLSYHLPLPVGMPPGSYTLFLQPFAGEHGPALGAAQPLADVEIAAGAYRPSSLPIEPFSLRFDNGLTLKYVETPVSDVRPGHTLPLALYWQGSAATPPPSELSFQLDVMGPDGTIRPPIKDPPGADWPATWPLGALIKEETGIYIRPDTEPGRYRLRWRLQDGDEPVPARPSWRPWSSEEALFGEIEVKPWPLNTTVPDGVNVVQADFGVAIQLYGYELASPQNGSLELTLYWQAQAVPQKNYLSFIHLIPVDDDSLPYFDQWGGLPVEALRPTKGWRPGEVLADTYHMDVSAVPAGRYALNVGLFEGDTGQRLPVTYQGEPQANSQLTLETVTLP